MSVKNWGKFTSTAAVASGVAQLVANGATAPTAGDIADSVDSSGNIIRHAYINGAWSAVETLPNAGGVTEDAVTIATLTATKLIHGAGTSAVDVTILSTDPTISTVSVATKIATLPATDTTGKIRYIVNTSAGVVKIAATNLRTATGYDIALGGFVACIYDGAKWCLSVGATPTGA